MTLHTKMEDAWDYIWDGLYCDTTHLFYDYRTSLDPDARFAHLPKPEEIAKQFPNPCGWGVGMEDSMLNAGSIMDVLRLRYELEHDPAALSSAEKVLTGMELCTTVHGKPGFVARSVSPDDGMSCYGNSSRDQFTLCVYGAWRFWRSFPEAGEELKTRAVKVLTNIAGYCEQVIGPDNDSLLRLDGQPALVSTMVDVQVHECMRLSMIYAAAWNVTQDEHWLKLYRQYAITSMGDMLEENLERTWNDWEIGQMQVALELLKTIEDDAQQLAQYRKAMILTAKLAEERLSSQLYQVSVFPGQWDAINPDWRQMKMVVNPDTICPETGVALYGGYPYLMPQWEQAYHRACDLLRSIGNMTYSVLLCDDYEPSRTAIDGFSKIAQAPDYAVHTSPGPINLLHGYWVGRYRKIW